jgi:hypothetical protein
VFKNIKKLKKLIDKNLEIGTYREIKIINKYKINKKFILNR